MGENTGGMVVSGYFTTKIEKTLGKTENNAKKKSIKQRTLHLKKVYKRTRDISTK